MSRRRTLPGRLAQVIQVILPWPAPHERKAAIAAARREKEKSRASAEQAAGLEAAITRMARENHFAEAIASQIIHRARDGA